MDVHYAKQAVKAIKKLDASAKQRIRQSINAIPAGDIKKLQGHTELFRLRIGDWRILFSYIDADTVLIARISSRGTVYKGEL